MSSKRNPRNNNTLLGEVVLSYITLHPAFRAKEWDIGLHKMEVVYFVYTAIIHLSAKENDFSIDKVDDAHFFLVAFGQ